MVFHVFMIASGLHRVVILKCSLHKVGKSAISHDLLITLASYLCFCDEHVCRKGVKYPRGQPIACPKFSHPAKETREQSMSCLKACLDFLEYEQSFVGVIYLSTIRYFSISLLIFYVTFKNKLGHRFYILATVW